MSQLRISSLSTEAWLGLVTIAFGLFYAFSTLVTVEVSSMKAVISGRTFPYIIAGMLVVLGAAMTVVSVAHTKVLNKLAAKGIEAPHLKAETENAPIGKYQLARLASYFGLLVLYLLGMEYVGYMVSSAVMMLASMWIFGARNKVVMAVLTVVTPVALYYFFHFVIEVQFPDTLLV